MFKCNIRERKLKEEREREAKWEEKKVGKRGR
jgi:hypothetical protein